MKRAMVLGVMGAGAMLLSPGLGHAADSGSFHVGRMASSFSDQRASAHEYFSLLTARDGSLKRSTATDGGIGHLLTGASYSALSKAQWYSASTTDVPYRKVAASVRGFDGMGADVARPAAAASGRQSQAYAMFLAGLGIVITVVRRRLRSF